MKYKIKFNTFLILIAMVMICPSQIYALWSRDNPPNKPREEFANCRMTCSQWIEFSGFSLTDYDDNTRLTKLRDPNFDKDASKWAALYAFRIGGMEPIVKFLPIPFCESIGEFTAEYTFLTIKEENSTCTGWMYLYGFIEYDYDYYPARYERIELDEETNNYAFNFRHAIFQNELTMKTISIWPYSYYKYITKRRVLIKPSEFCELMGLKIGEYATQKIFMNVHGPPLKCNGWIELYDYGIQLINVRNNWEKSLKQIEQEETNNVRVHDIVRDYSRHLRFLGPMGSLQEFMIPWMYCQRVLRVNDSQTFTYDYRVLSLPIIEE